MGIGQIGDVAVSQLDHGEREVQQSSMRRKQRLGADFRRPHNVEESNASARCGQLCEGRCRRRTSQTRLSIMVGR